jgi:hypothetical protein
MPRIFHSAHSGALAQRLADPLDAALALEAQAEKRRSSKPHTLAQLFLPMFVEVWASILGCSYLTHAHWIALRFGRS